YPHLQQVYSALSTAKKSQADQLSGKDLSAYLESQQQVVSMLAQPGWKWVHDHLGPVEKQIADSLSGPAFAHYMQQQWEAMEAAQQNAKQQETAHAAQIEERLTGAYNGIRSAVQSSIAHLFPNDPEGMAIALAATESRLYGSDEGAALWHELEENVRSGE